MRKPFILVSIPFKGEVNFVIEAVRSILSSYVSGFTYTMILWDDGSDDSDLNFLWSSVPREILIVKNQNSGYTHSVYKILDLAKNDKSFDFLLLCNSDVKFHTGTFFSLVKRILHNPNYAVVGGKILKWNSDIIQHTGTKLGPDKEPGTVKVIDPYCDLHKDDPRTNFVERRLWVNGCCMMMNLKVFRKENMNFDLEFSPAYFEEADLMTRLNIMGYSVIYEPRALVEHYVNATMNKERQKNEEVFWRNWNKYLEKWSPYFNSKQLQF